MSGPGGRGRPTRAGNKWDLGTTPGEAASSTGLRLGWPPGPRLTTSRDPHPHLLVSGVSSLPRRGLRSPTLGEVGNWLQAPCSSPPKSLRTPAETAAAPHPQTGLDPRVSLGNDALCAAIQSLEKKAGGPNGLNHAKPHSRETGTSWNSLRLDD